MDDHRESTAPMSRSLEGWPPVDGETGWEWRAQGSNLAGGLDRSGPRLAPPAIILKMGDLVVAEAREWIRR